MELDFQRLLKITLRIMLQLSKGILHQILTRHVEHNELRDGHPVVEKGECLLDKKVVINS